MGHFSNLSLDLEIQRDEQFYAEFDTAEASEAPDAPGSDKPAPPEPVSVQPKPEDTDAAKRQAHEAAEAKRRAEWEAKRAARKAAEQAQLDRLASMSAGEIAAASAEKISADTERLTRRNMKDCVSEHIQAMCRENPDFARQVLHPRKSMVHCFWYINRKARDFLRQEMKDNDAKPENGVYGGDVPDGLCYQWAVDYFNDPDAQEDQEKDGEFVPRPYYGGGKAKAKKAPEKKPPKPKGKPAMDGQLSLLGEAG